MTVFEWAERVQTSRPASWCLAVAAFLAALLIRFASDHLLPPGFPYLTFFPAVILTAFFAGLWPSIACAAASGLAAWYWFIPPFESFDVTPSTVIALLFYVGIIAVDIAVIHLMRHYMEGLRAERAVSEGLQERQRATLAELHARERRQRVLQRELSHRMKNTLSMVQAVVSQSLRHAPSVEAAAEAASARIQALGRSQDMLTESRWESADIRHVVDASLAPHVDREDRVRVSGPAVELDATQSMGLALALHELATNAVKYGALSVEAGRVLLDWECGEHGAFRLRWAEEGGPAVEPPVRRGFGSRLTERVVPGYFAGSAKVDYRPGGVEFRLDGRLRRDEPEGGGGAAA